MAPLRSPTSNDNAGARPGFPACGTARRGCRLRREARTVRRGGLMGSVRRVDVCAAHDEVTHRGSSSGALASGVSRPWPALGAVARRKIRVRRTCGAIDGRCRAGVCAASARASRDRRGCPTPGELRGAACAICRSWRPEITTLRLRPRHRQAPRRQRSPHASAGLSSRRRPPFPRASAGALHIAPDGGAHRI